MVARREDAAFNTEGRIIIVARLNSHSNFRIFGLSAPSHLRSKWAAGKARGGRISERYVTDEQRSRRPIFNATLRRGQLAVFPRCSLDPYDTDGHFARALKNSQLTCGETQGI